MPWLWSAKRTMVIQGKQWQYMDNLTFELLDYLHLKLKDFVTHNFQVQWQDKVLISFN